MSEKAEYEKKRLQLYRTTKNEDEKELIRSEICEEIIDEVTALMTPEEYRRALRIVTKGREK